MPGFLLMVGGLKMVEWVLSRATDILLALLVMAVALWCLLTQPVLSFSGGKAPELGLGPAMLDERVRAIASIAETQVDKQSRFNATAAYMLQQLEVIGGVEQVERGENLRIIHAELGDKTRRKLFIGLHYVITDHQIPEIVRAAVSFLELASLLSVQEQLDMHLDLSIFLHRDDAREALAQSLKDASVYHVDQLVQQQREDDLGLLFAPGLRIPDAAYTSDQWRYFNLLLPSADAELSLFGRLRDVRQLRFLKGELEKQGLHSINSLSIPVNFSGTDESPLKFYWERDLSVLLARSNMLSADDYELYINFISSLFGLIKEGA
ncbi:MAG: hypothetical protein R3F02_15245 [Thiolinea sp.]